ncbi:hypothetical protein SDC9_177599 [bioreactor metagenome]|uniref:Uncharacterized protein n=1 Tax=bioreactor metagenome TaxID=1076179 RepID=A0A645GTG2_9ZZZZ
MSAKVTGHAGANDFIDGVFYDTDGEPRRNIVNAGTLFLGLLHRGVHKDGAA